jgi:hypothetical protein
MILLLAMAAAAPAPDLGAYAGKYPFDKVRGVTFLAHPVVTAAVARIVPSAPLRKTILDPDAGPADTISVAPASVHSWACQAHNCGDHQWSITIDRKSREGVVCLHDAATMGERSRWYLAAGRTEMRGGNCQ